MRISEVVAQTGISKRNIYFYVEEGLLTPATDLENGYHVFGYAEVQKLRIIAKLRALDFSLADIRSILQFPGTASLHFYRQMEQLTEKIRVLQHNVQSLAEFFESSVPLADQSALLSGLEAMRSYIPPTAGPEFTERDAKLIPMFIWAPYLTKPQTEYQEFIWTKLSKKITTDYQPFLRNMRAIISAIRPEQQRYSADQSARQMREIANLQRDAMELYAQKMLGSISVFLDNEALVRRWNLAYPALICPLLGIGYSEISDMMFLLSEEYRRFYDNVCVLCELVWRLLTTTPLGRSVYERMGSRLGLIDWEKNGKGELERMAGFSFSPYAELEIVQLERLLEK